MLFFQDFINVVTNIPRAPVIVMYFLQTQMNVVTNLSRAPLIVMGFFADLDECSYKASPCSCNRNVFFSRLI